MALSPLKLDEKKILHRLKEGDPRGLNQLMEAYKRPLAARIQRILKSSEDTEEVLQELFVRVWIHRYKIDVGKPIKAYLFRIAENLVFDMVRKANREKRFVSFYRQHQPESYDHIETEILRKENCELLERLMKQIPEHSRRVFALCKLEGLSYEEAGHQLGISVATVNSHMVKARKILQKYVNEHPSLWVLFAWSQVFQSELINLSY